MPGTLEAPYCEAIDLMCQTKCSDYSRTLRLLNQGRFIEIERLVMYLGLSTADDGSRTCGAEAPARLAPTLFFLQT